MRIERKGGPPDMEAVFKDFMLRCLNGRSLDDDKDRESALGKFPDFECLHGLILVEMKHLEADQEERINNVLDTKVHESEKPIFYGKRKIESDLRNLSNAKEIQRAIAMKLARTIENILKNANQQFEDYRKRNTRKNSISLCVILNSLLQEFDPEMIKWSIQTKMNGPAARFPHVDSIIYISEKHGTVLHDGKIAFWIVNYENSNVVNENIWKQDIIRAFVEKWGLWRYDSAYAAKLDSSCFGTVEDIPDRMTRSEYWQLEYRRHPYLSDLPDNKLKTLFHRAVLQNALGVMKGSWTKPTVEEMKVHLQKFAHINEEINRRGVNLRDFDPRHLSFQERQEVIQGFPDALIQMLPGLEIKRT